MNKLTIQPGLYFSPAAVDAMRAMGITDEQVAEDVDAFVQGDAIGAAAAWDVWRAIERRRPGTYVAGVLRMAADLVDGCIFYCDHKAEA